MATVTLKGKLTHTNGPLPKVGEHAPNFSLIDQKLSEKTLADFKGKKLIIYTVPSLDTPTCMISTKHLSELIKSRSDIQLIVVSADLPFAQSRLCGTEHLHNVTTLSMMKSKKFAEDYGVLITDGPIQGLCARSILSIDEMGKIVHTELVEEIANEPNYDKAFSHL